MGDDRLGWEAIEATVAAAQERLGDDLLSAYAIGSLAHGGFAPAVSDVDLALLTGPRVEGMEAILISIVNEVARTRPLGLRLSIFHVPWAEFADPPRGSRFPPIDRFDLVRHGVLVAGDDLRDAYATEPTAAQIRGNAVNSALRRTTPERLTEELAALAREGVDVHDATKLVLWPVRLQHTCDIAEAGGNAEAVAHYISLPDARHRELAEDALAWRDLPAIPDPDVALARIEAEIRDLHVEVFRRLGARPEIPRAAELCERAAELSSR